MLNKVHTMYAIKSRNHEAVRKARIRQLPSSKKWIASSRLSLFMTWIVLVSWISTSLVFDSMFLKEAVVSSFIIGCSIVFNRSNFTGSVLET